MQLGPVATIARLAAVVLHGLKQTQRALQDTILGPSKSQITTSFELFPGLRMLLAACNLATIRGNSRFLLYRGFLMKVAIESKDPSAICIQVTGKITQSDISPLREPLSDLLGPEVYEGRVLLDMSEVEVLDSSGVSWLLSCHKKFRTSDGNLLLHSLSPSVSNVLRVLNLDTILAISDSKEEALHNG